MKRVAITALALLPLATMVANGFEKAVDKQKGATGIEGETYEWTLPEAMQPSGYIDESKMPEGSRYSEMVILGNKIINETTRYIGPQAEDEAMRYAGSNLSCGSCHAYGGTRQYQSAYVGVYSRFPQFRGRGDSISTLEDRINGCMQRSLNGKPLPNNSVEMKAMVTYMQWLSQGIPVGAKVEGQGLVDIPYLDRAADPELGEEVYLENCVACHQQDGSGIVNPVADTFGGAYYIYPPLWGDDSYNDGAGMYRLMKAAAYIYHNMPQDKPGTLSIEEAYDVASYINSKPRPQKEGMENDFPDRRIKPVDSPFAPFGDEFSEEEHRLGPFEQMIK